MAENQELKDIASMLADEASRLADEETLKWMDEHQTEMRQYVSGQRLLYQSLVTSFVVGLAAHVGGYVLLSSAPNGILGLLADLLHALGWSLWTGAILAAFLQIWPEVKRRQIKQAVDAYKAVRREKKAQAVGSVLKRPEDRRAGHKQGQTRPRNRARKGR